MKVLFFAPHAAIWIHAFPEALVAEALRDGGHEIVYVTCGRQLVAGCIAMSAFGVAASATAERKAEICRQCDNNKLLLREGFGFGGYDLSALLSPEDRTEIRRLLGGVTRENFLDLRVTGVDVGRAALYEFLVEHKKSALEFSDDAEWRDYRAALENTLYATFGGRRVLEREAPDAVVAYNGLYSVNRAVSMLAAARGIPHYFLHAGGNLAGRLQTLMLAKGDIFDMLRNIGAAWPALREQPVEAAHARAVTDHFVELMRGRSGFAYSQPQTGDGGGLRRKFGVADDQKVLCATLSSYDERFAAEACGALAPATGLLFPLQVDWVNALIDYVRDRPELFLIVRVHPREFPNKRDGVKSAHAKSLERAFDALPSNVLINWPTDMLSLYDLAEITDVFLNSMSGVGKEMGVLGIPVVLYSKMLAWYPSDINYVGETLPDYFKAVEQALADGWRYENLVLAYRWLAVEYGHMLIDISDAFGASEYQATGLLPRAVAKLKRTLRPDARQSRDLDRRPRPIRAGREITSLFECGAATVLDPRVERPLRPTSGRSEADVLRAEVALLVQAMYPRGNASASKLGRHLESLKDSRHAA